MLKNYLLAAATIIFAILFVTYVVLYYTKNQPVIEDVVVKLPKGTIYQFTVPGKDIMYTINFEKSSPEPNSNIEVLAVSRNTFVRYWLELKDYIGVDDDGTSYTYDKTNNTFIVKSKDGTTFPLTTKLFQMQFPGFIKHALISKNSPLTKSANVFSPLAKSANVFKTNSVLPYSMSLNDKCFQTINMEPKNTATNESVMMHFQYKPGSLDTVGSNTTVLFFMIQIAPVLGNSIFYVFTPTTAGIADLNTWLHEGPGNAYTDFTISYDQTKKQFQCQQQSVVQTYVADREERALVIPTL